MPKLSKRRKHKQPEVTALQTLSRFPFVNDGWFQESVLIQEELADPDNPFGGSNSADTRYD